MMKVRRLYVANDTSAYHGGSWAVCRSIERFAAAAGWSVCWERDRSKLEAEVIEECDAVMVNGEGTLHDDLPRARHLLAILHHAQERHMPTALCNASWANMGPWCRDIVRKLDQVSVREPVSARSLKEDYGVASELAFDLAYSDQTPWTPGERSVRLLATDFYAREFDAFAFINGGRFLGVPRLDMRTASWQDTLNQVAQARVLICGRFHGLVAAARTRTRFVLARGNTPKIEGVLEWFAPSEPLGWVADHRMLIREAVQSHRMSARYDRFFDWVQSLPPWRFPFS